MVDIHDGRLVFSYAPVELTYEQYPVRGQSAPLAGYPEDDF
jgi:hypothetical protein